jgi:DNA-binding NtrC family response regulator
MEKSFHSSPPPFHHLQMLRILVVDDDETVCLHLFKCFSLKGYKVFTCRNGNEALRLISLGQSVDAILSDVEMPECDGFSLLKRLRRAGNKTPFFVMSATHSNHSIRHTDAAGFCAKPLRNERISFLYESILRTVQGSEGSQA